MAATASMSVTVPGTEAAAYSMRVPERECDIDSMQKSSTPFVECPVVWLQSASVTFLVKVGVHCRLLLCCPNPKKSWVWPAFNTANATATPPPAGTALTTVQVKGSRLL